MLKARTLVDGYNIIGCDVLNIGSKDLAEGTEFVREMREIATFPFISANILDKKTEELLFEPYKIITKNNFQVGILGLTTRLPDHVEDLALLDPVEEGRKILTELVEKSDYQIVLFNGTYKEAQAAEDSLKTADFIFLSGDTRSPSRRNRERSTSPRLYRLGRQGRALGIIHLDIEDVDVALSDITNLKSKESFISRQLERLRKKDPSKEIEEIYKDQPRILERIRKMKSELNSIQQQLAMTKNTVKFDFVAMSRKIEDDPQLLAMINETLAECKRIASSGEVTHNSRKAESNPVDKTQTSIKTESRSKRTIQ